MANATEMLMTHCCHCGHLISRSASGTRSIMRCPKCGAEITPGQSFCIICGTPLKKEPAPAPENHGPQPGTKVCPNCGKVLADHLSFCTSCGTKLN